MPPDRLSMHGTWCFALNGDAPPAPSSSRDRALVAVCRRSGSLEFYDGEYLSTDPNCQPLWKAWGCSHGVSILGQSDAAPRRPEHHDVEAAEIRVFVSGPSLRPSGKRPGATEKDSWMLRSLCVLVDTPLGDLQLYSGSKRQSNHNRLEFSRV